MYSSCRRFLLFLNETPHLTVAGAPSPAQRTAHVQRPVWTEECVDSTKHQRCFDTTE